MEAGVELGISKSWASRLHAQAVEKLRAVVDS
jgi:DNA-directed RNA polymerase specialized sigma subunit